MQPGFRWNFLDGKWQRFPQQAAPRTPPPVESPLGRAAHELYNLSWGGARERDVLQYLVVAGVTQVFADPTAATRH